MPLRSILLVLVLFLNPVFAEENAADGEAEKVVKKKCALIPFYHKKLAESDLKEMTKRFHKNLGLSDKFEIKSLALQDSVWSAKGLAVDKPCYSKTCIAEYGRAVRRPWVIVPRVKYSDSKFSFQVMVVDVKQKKILSKFNKRAKDDIDQIYDVLEDLAKEIIIFHGGTPQEEKPIVIKAAIMDLIAKGVDKDMASSLTDALRNKLMSTGNFEIVEREQMDKIMQEQAFQMTGACNDADCMAQAGKILGIKHMIAGSVGKVGEIYIVNSRLLDVETGEILFDVSVKYRGNIEGLIIYSVPQIANKMAKGIGGKGSAEGDAILEKKSLAWIWVVASVAIVGGGAAAFFLLADDNEPAVAAAPEGTLTAVIKWE